MKRTGRLFTGDSNSRTNAQLNVFPDSREAYIPGYYNAAIYLTSTVKNNKGNRHELIYPILFLYRHYIEIRIKKLIEDIQNYLAEPVSDTTSEHSIKKLWDHLKPLGVRVDPSFTDLTISDEEALIIKLDIIDPKSQSFRYALDKKGKTSIPKNQNVIGVENLTASMHDLFWLLEGLNFTTARRVEDKLFGNIA